MADLDKPLSSPGEPTNNDTSTNTQTSGVQTTSSPGEPPTQTADVATQLQASLELMKEMQQTNANLMKEIQDLKVANAKLALTQSVQAPRESAEELLNKMFT